MKKWTWGWIFILIFSLLAASCAGREIGGAGFTNAGRSDGKNETEEKVTISFWTLNAEWVKYAIDDFKLQYPNIEVELTLYDTDPIKETLKVAASSKTLPDIWFTWGGTLGSFYPEYGLSMDLTQVASNHNWSGTYSKAALDMVTFGNKITGIPFHVNVLGMWYSKNVYAKAGLKAPSTFAEFESQLQTLKDAGVIPLAFGSKGGWHTMRVTEQLLEHFAGPELHDKLNALSASWNDPAVVMTFEKLKEYTDKGYFPKGYSYLDPAETDDLLFQEQAGMIYEGTWFDVTINSEGFDNTKFDVFPFPSDWTPRRPSLFADMFQINVESVPAKQEAAIKLGEYLTSVDVINKYLDSYGTPATLSTKNSSKSPHVQLLLETAMDGGFLITDQALPQEVVQKLFEAQDKVALNEWTPAQAAEEMEKAAQAYKKKK
ncbi:ABC transporter substrate-binding protein [Cohnella sp.]|uniref:ABC transporter substrate-binding protein n=1 Tax=Cohnella sp. TaxID=1883426 RepID=UPI0035640423